VLFNVTERFSFLTNATPDQLDFSMTNKRHQNPQERVNAFLDKDGKVRLMPKRRTDRLLVLMHLVQNFEFDRSYSEPEVNDILKEANSFGDHVMLRRELYDHGLLTRNQDGTDYQRPQPSETPRLITVRKLQRNPMTPAPGHVVPR